MKMDLVAPCVNCPFRTDKVFHLRTERVREILTAITHGQKTFTCHNTLHLRDHDHQHCAGATILLEKIEKPNQWMRWMERISMYDPIKLRMDSPVFETPEAMIEEYRRRNAPTTRPDRDRSAADELHGDEVQL